MVSVLELWGGLDDTLLLLTGSGLQGCLGALGFRVWGLGFGVRGSGFGVWGLGFGVCFGVLQGLVGSSMQGR